MRAADLDDFVPLGRFDFERVGQALERRNQLAVNRQRHGHMDRRGEHVVGALTHVHVVVRMDRLFLGEAISTQELDGPIRDHFVGVHVARSARAGLKHIDRELLVELSIGHFTRRGEQGLDPRGIEPILAGLGELAQVAIGNGGGVFHEAERMDQPRGQRPARDWKVFDGSLGGRSVVGSGRHGDIAHRVVFDAKFALHRESRKKEIRLAPRARRRGPRGRRRQCVWDRFRRV